MELPRHMLADGIHEEGPQGIRVDLWWDDLWQEADRWRAQCCDTVVVGNRLSLIHGRLFSVHNNNEYFKLLARVAPEGLGADLRASERCVLILSGKAAGVSKLGAKYGSGSNGQVGYDAQFRVGRACADRISVTFGLERRDRRPLDDHVYGRFWLVRSTCRIGEPIGLVLEIANDGPELLRFLAGGRHEGANRDNNFSFHAYRDGCLLPDAGTPDDYGGMAIMVEIPPGKRTGVDLGRIARGTKMLNELYVDLRAWARFDRPGHYEIDCSYRGTFCSEENPDCDHDERAWDFVLSGKVWLNIVGA
jgi:hypothetical protein